jgi:hypothetical protein
MVVWNLHVLKTIIIILLCVYKNMEVSYFFYPDLFCAKLKLLF